MSFREKVIETVAELSFIPADDINQDDTLTSLGFDSLKMVELIVALEDEFNIVFNDSDLNPENLTAVESIINLIEKHTEE